MTNRNDVNAESDDITPNHPRLGAERPNDPTQRGRPWGFVVALVLAVILLGLALRGVDGAELLRVVRQGEVGWLILGGGALTLSYFLRGVRWRVLLSASKPVHLENTFWTVAVGYLGNYVLPARAGDLIRSVMMGRRERINEGYVFATTLSERILDAAWLVVAGLVVLSTLDVMTPELLQAVQVMAVLGVVGITGLLLAPRLRGLILALVRRLPLPERWRQGLEHVTGQFLDGMLAFQHLGRALGFAVMTLVVWGMDAVVFALVGRAFGLSVPWPVIVLTLVGLGLASAIPSTPGYVGVYQFVAVVVLTPFGVARPEALVYITAVQMVTLMVVVLLGGLGLVRLNLNLAALRRISAGRDPAT